MEDIYLILVLVSLICLVIGLIKPSVFSRFMKSWATRGKAGLIFGLAMIASIVLLGITSDQNEAIRQAETKKQVALIAESRPSQDNQDAVATETSTVVPVDTATEMVPAVEEVKKAEETFEVVRVIDGDTLTLNISGKKETLRLIGMDTPETVDPRKPVQCFAKEASDKAKAILTDKRVRIESDPSQGERDKYNRLLRYIFLENGTFFNKMMIEEGYAHEYTYHVPYKYQSEFEEAETRARENKRGLWGDVCDGDTMQSAEPAESTSPAPAPAAPAQSVSPTPTVAEPTPQSSSAYTCNCSKTCPNMSSCAEAQYQLNTCGCSARDADDDGVACDADCQ